MDLTSYKNKNEMDLTTDDFIEYMCEGIENKKYKEKVNKKNTVFFYSTLLNNLDNIEDTIETNFQIRENIQPSSIQKQTLQFPKEIII
jgi:hypothetical protein